MKTTQVLIALIALFILPTLFCYPVFADDTALKGLKSVRLTIKTFGTGTESESLSLRIRNLVELKLRQAGLNVRDNAGANLRLIVFWKDLDSDGTSGIAGKYGSVQFQLYETVFLARNAKVMTTACTWGGLIAYLHGPPDDFSNRTKESASELVDNFLNQWLKARK